jgi:cytochrome P450
MSVFGVSDYVSLVVRGTDKFRATFMTMNVVSDLSFGRSFNLPEDSEMQYTLAARAGAGKRLALSFQCPSLFRPGMGRRWLDVGRWLAPAGEAGRTSIVALASQWVKDRIEAQEKGKDTRKDIISFVISAIDPDTNDKLGEAELVAEANGLIVAGGGTTSVGISGLFFYLSRNRHAYERAAKEVRSSFSSLEEILTGPTLASCTYLHACVSESMRMSPPAPIAYYREAGSGGAVVSGHFIPQGLTCATGIYALHHNAAYFPEPFEFRPERWIPSKDNRPEQIQLAKSAYSPFSIGPRNCVAMPLANMEIVLLAARVLWQGDFRVADGPEGDLGAGNPELGSGRERKGEFQLYEQFGSTKKGPVLQFRRREVVR